MRDWELYVRTHLPLPHLTRERQSRIVQELATQFEDFYREAIARGMTESDADAFARAQITDWIGLASTLADVARSHVRSPMDRWSERLDDRVRRKKGVSPMDLVADLRYALRLLRKTPVFTVAAIGTLALGIGANTTIFSLVQTMLLRPLPYQDPDQVVMVWEDRSAAGFPRNTPAPANYRDWRARNRSFTDMAAAAFAFANLTGDGGPELVIGRRVTANFFSVLGVQPVVGRTFTAADDAMGQRVVVISHALWQRRYGGDPGIVGRTISMSGQGSGGAASDVKQEVVGVAPPSFVFLARDVDYWVPMQFSPEEAAVRGNHFLNVVARLKPGVTLEGANSDIGAIARRLSEEYPETNRDFSEAVVVPIREQVLGNTRVQVIALMTAAAVIVLIACANLASLLLARASVRRGEYAVRLSLGATRGRLARQVLVEALCLSIAGGVLGLAIPLLTTTFVERIVPVGLQSFAVSLVDWRLLVFAGALSIATGLLFSLGPVLQSARASTADVLQQHARGNTGGRSRAFRDGLVVLQVAATLVLLVAAGLMLRTLANLNAVERGFDADNVLTMVVPLMPKYAEPSKRPAFYDGIIAGVRALPGVRGVAFGSLLPFQSTGNTRSFTIEGRPRQPGDDLDVLFRIGTADYLQTLRVTLVEGRLLDARDGADAPRAVVVNETLVRRYLPGQSALGQHIRFDPSEPFFTIVGVVKDVLERGFEREAKPGVYVTQSQGPRFFPTVNLMVRVDNDPLGYAPAVQRIIRAVDPDQPIRLVRPMTEVIALTVGDRRQQTTILVVFGALALVIASLGLYGLLAQTVSARSREIGIRMALGATWRSVMGIVMSRGMVLTGAGVCIGAVLAWSVTRAMDSLLYGVGASDPVTFALVAGLLATVSAVACAIPAVRAARVDPMLVLRDQ
ncbi:MAG TPA: ABC transporter permease [Vicinamibacterales bacterium]|nr:ABC transporter permease [Vicinamibacterales bacterium]